jgi:hypothetical protein
MNGFSQCDPGLQICNIQPGKDYSASATTSSTSGIMRFIICSMPDFRVIMEEGHPLQLP